MPSIIAGIVAYNNPKELEQALASLVFCNLVRGIIIVDNSDEEYFKENIRVIKKYGKEKKEIRYLQNITSNSWNKGSARGFYIVMKEFLESDGSYLLLLDQDGKLDCSSLYNVFSVESDIYCPKTHDIKTKKEINWSLITGLKAGIKISKMSNSIKQPTTVLVCATNGMLIKRDVISDIKYDYKNYFVGLEDYDFCLRATKKGYKCTLFPDYIVYHPNLIEKHNPFKKLKYLIKRVHTLPTPFYFGSFIAENGEMSRMNIAVFSCSVMISKYGLIDWIVSFAYSTGLLVIKKLLFRKNISLVKTMNLWINGFIKGRRARLREL
nr:glycosyltransferase [Thermococcus stetteri]